MIETLSDDSQVLLLYLAEELPDVDRQAVERRLGAEPALSDELEELRSIYGEIQCRLEQADDVAGFPVNVSAITRSVGREMRQRLAEPRPVVAVAPRVARIRTRQWLIPSAVAAAILVAALVWMNHGGENKTIVKVMPSTSPAPTVAPLADENLNLFKGSFNAPSEEVADSGITGTSQKDSAPQDDISQYLLTLGSTQD